MVRTLMVSAALFCVAQPASAFYFEGWPGAGLTPRVSILSPGGKSVTIGLGETPKVEKPTERLKPPPEVPEPAGVALAVCGLAALSFWRRVRRPGGTAAA